jgi:hypothetical protein
MRNGDRSALGVGAPGASCGSRSRECCADQRGGVSLERLGGAVPLRPEALPPALRSPHDDGIEVKPRITIEKVIDTLKACGVEGQELAAGFISATIPKSAFPLLDLCVHLHPKAQKILR